MEGKNVKVAEKKVAASKKNNSDDHINMKYQDREYNEAYKNWRKRKKDSAGFYFVSNPNELTYQDGFGFVKDYPETAEAGALNRIYFIIGVAMLIFTSMDVLQTYGMPFLLNKLGADIYYDFYAGNLYGNDWLILLMHTFFEVAKRGIVFLFCYKELQMPFSVMLPMKISNKPMFQASVPIVLFVSADCMILSAVYNKILELARITPVAWMRLPEEPLPIVLTLLVDVVVVGVLSEICLHGLVLQLLRQFGDGLAIVIAGFISAAISYNVNNFCYTFLVSVVIGYFTIRTGSVITAVVMRIASRSFAYLMYLVDYNVSDNIKNLIIMAFLLVCILIGLYVTISLMTKRGDKFGIIMKPRYLSFAQKCMAAISCAPMVIWITLTFIVTLLNMQLSL